MVQLIGNRYRLEHELGTGGMGVVYKGLDTHTQQRVAVKQLRDGIAQPEVIARFEREGEALRDLNHPNIVKLLDTVEQDGQHYLVIEYVGGGDLKDLLKEGKIPYQRCINMAIDLADALTRAHRLNIIHRDLKPANILIGEDGTLLLTDFGVAYLENKERMTEAEVVLGTIDYMAPEAIDSETIDARVDVWGFGVVLFEMLTGQRPFDGKNIAEVLVSIFHKPLPDLETIAPELPLALVDLVYRMLTRDPQARISSVRHVGAELEDILQGRGTTPPAGNRFETPLSTSRLTRKHNLPAQMTPFVGRDAELSELARIIENPAMRLITLLGPGGMGKTRLSLEAAERQISNFEHGVYLVEMAPLSSSEHIIPAIASALSYQFQSGSRDPRQQLIEFLRSKQLLLVMDNFEDVLDSANLMVELLQAAPRLKILVTSRRRLDQPGEALFHLTGMDLADWENPDEALKYAVVKLFMNSALRVKPDFNLSDENLAAVAQICRLVQGMPLGIVLAASWLGMLSAEEIVDELQRGLDFLETDSQQVPARHRSIRAVMDYSWQQMSADEQQVFMQLSVFRGGFTREAAQDIAGANLRLLMSLVKLSLLHRDASSGRYEIHELLRQYAEEALQKNQMLESAQAKHAAYFAGFMASRNNDIKGRRQIAALVEIDQDFENIKTGWRYACQNEDADSISTMLEQVYWYCMFRNRNVEGLDLLQFARSIWLASDNNASLLAGRLLLRYPTPGGDLLAGYELGLAIARHHEVESEIAFGLRQVGHWQSHVLSKHDLGIPLLEESTAVYEKLGDKFHQAIVLDDLGWSYRNIGKRQVQIERVQRSIDLRREIGDKIGMANALRAMGAALGGLVLGSVEPLYKWQEALELSREIGDKRNIAWNSYMVGLYHVFDGEIEKSLPYRSDAAVIAQAVHEEVVYKSCLILDAIQEILLNEDYVAAGKLMNVAYPPGSPPDARESIHASAFILLTCSSEDYAALKTLALKVYETSQEQRDFVWRWIVVMGGLLAIHDGQLERGVEWLGTTSAPTAPKNRFFKDWRWYQRYTAELEAHLGSEVYRAALQRGSERIFVEAVHEVGEYLQAGSKDG